MKANLAMLRVTLFWGMISLAFAVHGQSLLPEDTCIVELQLPPGAKVTVDGRDYGEKRQLKFGGLNRGQIYRSQAKIILPDGARTNRSLVLKGGWHVVCPLRPIGSPHPELVLQAVQSKSPERIVPSGDGRHALVRAGSAVILWDMATGRQLRTYTDKGIVF